MKTLILSSLVLGLILLAACTTEVQIPPEPQKVPPEEQPPEEMINGWAKCPEGSDASAKDCGNGSPALYDPACGIDGRTYWNACVACQAGVAWYKEGACASPSPVDREPERYDRSREDWICTSDTDCGEGYSCYSRLPAGPGAGIKGTPEEPGHCYDQRFLAMLA